MDIFVVVGSKHTGVQSQEVRFEKKKSNEREFHVCTFHVYSTVGPSLSWAKLVYAYASVLGFCSVVWIYFGYFVPILCCFN